MNGKVCVVSGAASGIGRQTALLLAGSGARVAALDIDEPGLKSLADEAPLWGTYPVDVADGSAAREVVADVVGRTGTVDSCLTFAAVVDDWGAPAEVGEQVWERVLAVNLRGTTQLCAAVLPAMPPGSSIVTCSSIAGGLKPSPTRTPYTAAKAAVIAYTRDLAVAYGPAGVRVNTLIPGFIDTPMSRQLVRGHERQADAERERIPLRRLGNAAEVAQVAAFLAGESASYMTGAVLVVDGGLSLV